MGKYEKMHELKEKLSRNNMFSDFEIKLFRGKEVLAFEYRVVPEAPLRAIFYPDDNVTVVFWPTDDSMTNAQWVYVEKSLDEILEDGYKEGVFKTCYNVMHVKEMSAMVFSMPMQSRGKGMSSFDVDIQYKAILNFKEEVFFLFLELVRKLYNDFGGRTPHTMYCNSEVHAFKEIKNKRELLLQVMAIFFAVSGAEDMDASVLAVMSIKDTSILFGNLMESYPDEKKKILLAIKKYYSPSTWTSISDEGMQSFFEDLHEEFINACCG